MSVIEKRLEKAEQEAEAARLELYAEEPEVPAVEAKPEDDKTGDEPAVIDEGVAAGGEGVAVEDEPVEVKPGEVIPKKEDDSDGFKQKFQVLEGKYKAEVPRLSAELAQWKEYAGGLQARITALEETAKVIPPAKETIPEDDYEVEAFVSDNPGAAKLIKKIEDKHKAELASLRDEIRSVDQKTVAATSEFKQTTAMDRFEKAMSDAGVSDWRTIDAEPGFMEWLNRSPYNIRVLQAAASEFDAKTVSSFFVDYKRSLEGNGSNLPPDNGDGSQDKLKKFTAPPRSDGGGPPPKSETQPALTRSNYERFMAQTTNGKYKPSQWGGLTEAQMDARFDAAIAKNALL